MTGSPKEIAAKISQWLSKNCISQRFFVSKVVNRSQGSLSDFLSKAPNHMPKTHARAIRLKLDESLKCPRQQEDLLSEFKKGS